MPADWVAVWIILPRKFLIDEDIFDFVWALGAACQQRDLHRLKIVSGYVPVLCGNRIVSSSARAAQSTS